MQTVYHAADPLEAHMLAGLLAQHHIDAWVLGDALQGALGELPAGNLVRVVTRPQDYLHARAVIEQWETQQPRVSPPGAPSPPTEQWHASRGWPTFLLGVLTGMLLAALLLE